MGSMKRVLMAVAAFVIFGSSVYSQEGLSIYGFFQASAFHVENDYTFKTSKLNPLMGDSKKSEAYTSYQLQQANLLMRNEFNDNFSAFLNLEFTNNYNSLNGWGSFGIKEAFMRYQLNDQFTAKVGMFIPKFNNLYEIYEKTPLLPYAFRPFVYETVLESVIDQNDFLPNKAFAQIEGFLPVDEVKLDYAAYFGNIESKYITSSEKKDEITTSMPVYGMNQKNDLAAFGARIGARYNSLKVGVSFAKDMKNMNNFSVKYATAPAVVVNFGDVPRTKIGVDFNVSQFGFTLAGEMIMTSLDLDDTQETTLKATSKGSKGIIGEETNKLFYFTSLKYNISDEFFVYGMYNYFQDKMLYNTQDGLKSISGGIGYSPIPNVTFKAQYFRNDSDNKLLEYTHNGIMIATSVAF